MRKLVLGTLLVLMPFSGMRVMCIDAPTDVSRSSARPEPVTDCERLCPLHEPSGTPPSTGSADSSENGSDCVLSAGAASLIVFASATSLRPQEPLQAPLVVPAVYADAPPFYPEPALAHLGPPPKRKAL